MLAGLAVTSVHTTGINWEGVAAIVGLVALITSVIIIPSIRGMRTNFETTIERKIYAAVNQGLDAKLKPIQRDIEDLIRDTKAIDTRVARLEGVEEGKLRATNQILSLQASIPAPPDGKNESS